MKNLAMVMLIGRICGSRIAHALYHTSSSARVPASMPNVLLAFVRDAALVVELFRVALATLAGVSSVVLLATLRLGGMWRVTLKVRRNNRKVLNEL